MDTGKGSSSRQMIGVPFVEIRLVVAPVRERKSGHDMVVLVFRVRILYRDLW